MISLSPLPSAHPSAFQRTPVRASIPCYRNFTLAKGRSLGFASASTDLRPIRTRFRFGSSPKGINLASEAQLVGSLCKRHAVTPYRAPTACRHKVSGSLSPPCSGYFSPFPHGTSPLSVSREYLALPDGAGNFTQGASNPVLLRIPLATSRFKIRDFHPLRWTVPGHFSYPSVC